MLDAWLIRRLRGEDSIDELTELLHRAYAPLAERGLRYLATHQDAETTRKRASQGDCFVAVTSLGELIGTIVVLPPASGLDHGNTTGRPGPSTYAKPGVSVFGQYGVKPEWKGRGVGRLLHDHAADHARRLGATSIACDTAAPAEDLVAMYERWGYRVVERFQWDVTNYESVILEKPLEDAQ